MRLSKKWQSHFFERGCGPLRALRRGKLRSIRSALRGRASSCRSVAPPLPTATAALGCGGDPIRGQLAHLRAEKCFLPRTRRGKKQIAFFSHLRVRTLRGFFNKLEAPSGRIRREFLSFLPVQNIEFFLAGAVISGYNRPRALKESVSQIFETSFSGGIRI